MDFINEKQSIGDFPFETLHRLKNSISQQPDSNPAYSTRSYDNRGRISDVAASLQSRLEYFKTRLASNSFLSDIFSWQVKTASTSDPDILLAKTSKNSQEKDFSIEVDDLATIRTSVSEKFVSSDASSFETGTYSYTLTIGSHSYDTEVDVENKINAPATNRMVLLDVERSINRLGINVDAKLYDKQVRDYNPYRENAYKDISWLSVTSKTTGEDIEFTLSDTDGSLITTLGLDRVTSFGHKNSYTIDGTKGESNSNDIILESDNVQGYLMGTTGLDSNVQVNIKNGKTALTAELNNIISDYNELIKWIDDNDHVISSGLKTELFKDLSTSITRNKILKEKTSIKSLNAMDSHVDFASAINLKSDSISTNTIDEKLIAIGLTLNHDGTIEVGESFSTSVLSNFQDVYDTLAGSDGFFTDIAKAIDTIHDKNESNYIFKFNSVLSYDGNGTNRQSIYKSNSSNIISFFA